MKTLLPRSDFIMPVKRETIPDIEPRHLSRKKMQELTDEIKRALMGETNYLGIRPKAQRNLNLAIKDLCRENKYAKGKSAGNQIRGSTKKT